MGDYFPPYGPYLLDHNRYIPISPGPEKYILMLYDEVQIKQDGPYYNMRGTVGGLDLDYHSDKHNLWPILVSLQNWSSWEDNIWCTLENLIVVGHEGEKLTLEGSDVFPMFYQPRYEDHSISCFNPYIVITTKGQ